MQYILCWLLRDLIYDSAVWVLHMTGLCCNKKGTLNEEIQPHHQRGRLNLMKLNTISLMRLYYLTKGVCRNRKSRIMRLYLFLKIYGIGKKNKLHHRLHLELHHRVLHTHHLSLPSLKREKYHLVYEMVIRLILQCMI